MALPETTKTPEIAPVVERPTVPEIPPEIEHMEAIAGAEITLPQAVTDDQGQPLVSPVAPAQVTVTLPLTDEEMNRALHLKIIYAARWLGEWMKRLIKIISGKFVYKSSNS